MECQIENNAQPASQTGDLVTEGGGGCVVGGGGSLKVSVGDVEKIWVLTTGII